MNEHCVAWIWHYSKLVGPVDLLVMQALATHANALGEATVKLAELARMCKLSELDVKASLRSAVKSKELKIYQNTNSNGTRLTNTYRFIGYAGERKDNGEIDFSDDIPLPGIPPPQAKPEPPDPRPKIMMDAVMLEAIASDPLYKGIDVKGQAWKFRRWCQAQVPPAEETVRRFKVWLARV